MLNKIKDLCTQFFEMLKIEITSLDIKCENEERNIYFINLQTPDSKLIIGMHGQNLESIKHVLSRMIESLIQKQCIIHLEINDYLKAKDEKLYRYIDGRIDYVLKTQKTIKLPDFTAYERKKIHNYLSDKKIDSIKAYSEGEGVNRFMYFEYCKPVNMDIDVDGTDI
ncbi:KH domain-containing protein [Candidatus Gracilibacteria bacterium]|nr:KH domain-containing protein [Candidatus Gracilibacteria bacterium]